MNKINFKHCETEVIIPRPVIKTLCSCRQVNSSELERGGLLFGQIINSNKAIVSIGIEVEAKQKGPFFCSFSNRTENKIIKEEYKYGNYLLGKWHTHYECNPTPSSTDISSMKEFFSKSKHNMPFFLMLIIGKDGSLYLGVVNNDVHEFKIRLTGEGRTNELFKRNLHKIIG